jgi:hypothetical protein
MKACRKHIKEIQATDAMMRSGEGVEVTIVFLHFSRCAFSIPHTGLIKIHP